MKWIDRIERAMKSGNFTYKDRYMSDYFTTCAVGEHFNLKDIERFEWNKHLTDKYGYNKGNKIYDLGIDFLNAIKSDEMNEAKIIYNKIQRFKVI